MVLSHPTGSSWFSLSLYSVVEGSSSPGFSISSSFMILASVLKYFNSTSILLLQVFLFNFNIASIPLQYTDSPRRKSSFYLEIQAFHTHKKDQHLSQSFYIPDLFLQCCFCNWIKDIWYVLFSKPAVQILMPYQLSFFSSVQLLHTESVKPLLTGLLFH